MTEQHRSRTGADDDSSEELFERLFRHASARPQPPDADTQLIRDALHSEWSELTGRRVLLLRIAFATAAAVLLAVVSLLILEPFGAPEPGAAMARIERATGSARVSGALRGEREQPAVVGAEVLEGQALVTEDGYAAVQLVEGGSLRLAKYTQTRFISGNKIELVTGAVYFDSYSGTLTRGKLELSTPKGTLTNLGTQFIARVDGSNLEVGVREGRVSVNQGDAAVAVDEGELLRISDGQAIQRESIAVSGPRWEWAENLAPAFEIDGEYLLAFLEWVARETGRDLRFDDPATREIAAQTTLNGSIDLAPQKQLAAVMATTELGYSLTGDAIVIARE